MAGHWPRPSVCAGLGRVFGLVALPAPVPVRPKLSPWLQFKSTVRRSRGFRL